MRYSHDRRAGHRWAVAATRLDAVRRRAPLLAWSLVIVLAILPPMLLFTQSPLRLAFFASRPALDRLADRVAMGESPLYPVRAGFFLIVGSAVDPSNGNVGLIIDPDPSGRSGFVRLRPGSKASGRGHIGPFLNLACEWKMTDDWVLQTED